MSVAATERELVYEGMRTPWGPAQSARILIPGIGLVDTAGHGGLKLSRERNKRVPAYAHDIDGGWYEEDCACNIPLTIFREELMRDGPDWIKESLTKHDPALTWKQYFPDSYSRYFNVTVTAAESCIIRDREFTAAHLNDYVACSAYGSWHERVPEGSVGVFATLGGLRKEPQWGAGKYFMVPDSEYSARNGNFVVDLARHPEIAPL